MEDSEIRSMLCELFSILGINYDLVSDEELEELVEEVKKHIKISRGDFERDFMS